MATENEQRIAALRAMQTTIDQQKSLVDAMKTSTLDVQGPEIERLFRMQKLYHEALFFA
jgi:hypothetical protein